MTHSLLVCAQYLREGNGGIAQVARLTTEALSGTHPVTAIACMEESAFHIGDVPVRAHLGSRARFVIDVALEARRSSHLLYDFAGTARAQAACALWKRPYAAWVHGWEVWDDPRRDHVSALDRANLVLVNSEYTRERAGDALSHAKDVRVCPLATHGGTTAMPRSDGPPKVLLLGRVDRLFAKGHDILVDLWPRVIAAVPDARLVFAGSGDALDRLRSLVAASAARDSIDVLGFVPEERLEDVWRNATILCMPAFAEGFGLVYAEAMRRGLPVIASREDAGQEINVHDVTGYNISREKPDELQDTIIALLRDRDLCHRLGAAGQRRWREEYTFESFAKRLRSATADFLN